MQGSNGRAQIQKSEMPWVYGKASPVGALLCLGHPQSKECSCYFLFKKGERRRETRISYVVGMLLLLVGKKGEARLEGDRIVIEIWCKMVFLGVCLPAALGCRNLARQIMMDRVRAGSK